MVNGWIFALDIFSFDSFNTRFDILFLRSAKLRIYPIFLHYVNANSRIKIARIILVITSRSTIEKLITPI